MEIRTLRYFLAVAREENMTKAAEILHVTQPTLSKALKALEEELGKKLFTRRSFSIALTEEGALLRDRAENLVLMADKIEKEFLSLDDITGGDLFFGLAESYQIRYLAREIKAFKKLYPGLQYHITSGDTEQVTEKLDKGLLDFAVICETPDDRKYHSIPFPKRTISEPLFRLIPGLQRRMPSRSMIWPDFRFSVPSRAGRMISVPGLRKSFRGCGWREPSDWPITAPCLQKKALGFS